MEYIEREIFINNELIPLVKTLDLCHPKQKKGVLMAISKLKEAPTANVVEIRHGEWVKDRATIKCSCCGFGMFQDGYFFMDGECFSTNNDKYTPNYCPHCGAKMDGKDGE